MAAALVGACLFRSDYGFLRRHQLLLFSFITCLEVLVPFCRLNILLVHPDFFTEGILVLLSPGEGSAHAHPEATSERFRSSALYHQAAPSRSHCPGSDEAVLNGSPSNFPVMLSLPDSHSMHITLSTGQQNMWADFLAITLPQYVLGSD